MRINKTKAAVAVSLALGATAGYAVGRTSMHALVGAKLVGILGVMGLVTYACMTQADKPKVQARTLSDERTIELATT